MISKIIERITNDQKSPITIGLFTHKNCDYDALASTFTLATYISTNIKKDIRVIPVTEKKDFDIKINTINEASQENQCKDLYLDYAVVLDVNEQDRLYGMELFSKTPVENRFLIDHHIGNREELEIPTSQKLVVNNASSTCEILAELLMHNNLSQELANNLFLGIASDTAGFTRGIKDNTQLVCDLLPCTENWKDYVINKMTTLTPEQQKLYDEITEELDTVLGLDIYKLEKDKSFESQVGSFLNPQIEEKIEPTGESEVSCLVITCDENVFLKIRKSKTTNFDIVDFAEHCNGGGHEDRAAGKFFNTTYENVLEHVKNLYSTMKNNQTDKKVMKK